MLTSADYAIFINFDFVGSAKAVPAAEIQLLEYVISKDMFTVTEKGKTVVQFKFKLDPAKNPKEIFFAIRCLK